jgi:hypothetical protein
MDATMAPPISIPRQAANFAGHFLEMCVSMCAVGTPIVLALFSWAPSTFGFARPADSAPELALVLIALIYAAPMVAWMRFRGMPARPVAEMAIATLVTALALIALRLFGVLSVSEFAAYVGPRFCGLACGVMVVAMLPRLSLYTGRSGPHGHHAAMAG